MSLLYPSRSHYPLAIFLWLSMLFLVWQHYHGLGQIPGRPINKGMTAMLPQSDSSALRVQPDENESSDNTPVNPPQQPKQPSAPAVLNGVDALLSSVEKTSMFFVNDIPHPSDFRNIGDRLSILSTWISARENLHSKMPPTQLQTLVSGFLSLLLLTRQC